PRGRRTTPRRPGRRPAERRAVRLLSDDRVGRRERRPDGQRGTGRGFGDWAEADPGSAQTPMCFFSSGMLADFLGRLSGEPVAVMEVECRSRNDGRCRFLSASPDTLNTVYAQMTEGRDYT